MTSEKHRYLREKRREAPEKHRYLREKRSFTSINIQEELLIFQKQRFSRK
jgi:hypothetical protein